MVKVKFKLLYYFGEEKIKCWHHFILLQDLINEGHAATQLVNQLHDVVVENDDLSDKQKSIITEKLAEVDKCLADGADEHLQLISLCAIVMQQLTQNC